MRIFPSAMILLTFSPLFGMNVERYLEGRKDEAKEPAVRLYVDGVGEGFSWANVFLENAKQPKMFCAPPKLSLTAQNYEDMIDERIKAASEKMSAKQLASTPIELMLLDALTKTFPCSADRG